MIYLASNLFMFILLTIFSNDITKNTFQNIASESCGFPSLLEVNRKHTIVVGYNIYNNMPHKSSLKKIKKLKEFSVKSRLTFVKRMYKDKWGAWYSEYKCICGNMRIIPERRVNSEYTKSCGCLQRETARISICQPDYLKELKLKRCSGCEKVKAEKDFYRRLNGTCPKCKQCSLEIRKETYRKNFKKAKKKTRTWYWNNRAYAIKRESEYRMMRIKISRDFVNTYLSEHPCVDCGMTDIRVLEFDHVRGVKVDCVAYFVARGKSPEKILEEINKCEVRCANCHRIRHYAKKGWKNIPEIKK